MDQRDPNKPKEPSRLGHLIIWCPVLMYPLLWYLWTPEYIMVYWWFVGINVVSFVVGFIVTQVLK